MVMFVSGGVDMFNASMYAQPTQQDVNFFENNINTFYNTLGVTGQNFFGNLRDRIVATDFSKLKEYTQAAARRVASFWTSDTIRPLTTLAEIQFPPNEMIRYLMANPEVRELYHNGMCEGYGDKYVDLQPNEIGENHHDYEMVMHGMEQTDEEGDIYWTSYDETFDEPENSVELLTIDERVDILESWAHTGRYLDKMKQDPTSQYSGML